MSKIQLKNWEYDKDAPKTMERIINKWILLTFNLGRLNEGLWVDGIIALSIPYSAELELMYEKEKRGEL